jgi:hypothetical protein
VDSRTPLPRHDGNDLLGASWRSNSHPSINRCIFLHATVLLSALSASASVSIMSVSEDVWSSPHLPGYLLIIERSVFHVSHQVQRPFPASTMTSSRGLETQLSTPASMRRLAVLQRDMDFVNANLMSQYELRCSWCRQTACERAHCNTPAVTDHCADQHESLSQLCQTQRHLELVHKHLHSAKQSRANLDITTVRTCASTHERRVTMRENTANTTIDPRRSCSTFAYFMFFLAIQKRHT